MSAPNSDYLLVEWQKSPTWWRQTVEHVLYERFRVCLGRGYHTFGSLDELFSVVGIGHSSDGKVALRSLHMAAFRRSDASGIFLKMSYRRFAQLVRRMNGVRLDQNSRWRTEREGEPRIVVIVS